MIETYKIVARKISCFAYIADKGGVNASSIFYIYLITKGLVSLLQCYTYIHTCNKNETEIAHCCN